MQVRNLLNKSVNVFLVYSSLVSASIKLSNYFFFYEQSYKHVGFRLLFQIVRKLTLINQIYFGQLDLTR